MKVVDLYRANQLEISLAFVLVSRIGGGEFKDAVDVAPVDDSNNMLLLPLEA